MAKVPKCLRGKIWELLIKELDRVEITQPPSFKEQELRKFAQELIE